MTIRATLTVLVLLLGGALLAAVTLLVVRAWHDTGTAERYALSDAVRASFLIAGSSMMRERSQTYVALLGPTPAGTLGNLAALREWSDLHLARALDALDRSDLAPLVSGTTTASLASARSSVLAIRAQVDAALKQPVEARPPELAEQSFAAATALINQAQNLRLELQRALPAPDRSLAEHSALKNFVWVTAEQVGRVDALIAGALAQRRPPLDAEYAAIARSDAQADLSWQQVRDLTRGWRAGRMTAAITKAENAYFGRLMAMRERIYRAARRHEPLPVLRYEWTDQATAALEALMAVQLTSVAETAAHLSDLAARTRRNYLAWSVIGGLGVIAVMLSLYILNLRVLRPLQALTGTMARLAEGDLTTPVPDYPRKDELGAMVQALRTSKARALQAARLRAAKERAEQEASRAIQDREARLRAILNSVTEGILTVDPRGRVESANPAALQLFGRSPETILGHSIAELVPADEQLRFSQEVQRYVDTGSSPLLGTAQEVTGRHADGTLLALEVTITEAELATQRIVTASVRDIAARKAVDRMKSEFIATVSHELRTPLTSIRGSLALLLGPFGNGLAGQTLSLLEMAHRNAERLIALVNDILDIERIEGGRLEFSFRPVDLVTLAREAVEANQGFAAERGVTLRLAHAPDHLQVMGDSGRFLQAMANLLSNAAKFSDRGTEVVVELAREQDAARVIVRDTGLGIPEDFHARVFQKFAQADSGDTRAQGGTGLGLSICKAIVERHGGRIGFESRPGATSFFFTIPLLAGSGARQP